MKDDDLLPSTTSSSSSAASSSFWHSVLFGRVRYKFWVPVAILLLAFWSMLTGTVSLRWSAGILNSLSEDIDTPIHEDLDVLEMEEREKDVRRMWDVYTNSRRTKLPSFWEEAFKAAYEELTSDVPDVRDAAISEIARMSVRISIDRDLDPPPLHSANARESSKSLEVAEKRGTATTSEGNGQ